MIIGWWQIITIENMFLSSFITLASIGISIILWKYVLKLKKEDESN
jgi:hypothetical protein